MSGSLCGTQTHYRYQVVCSVLTSAGFWSSHLPPARHPKLTVQCGCSVPTHWLCIYSMLKSKSLFLKLVHFFKICCLKNVDRGLRDPSLVRGAVCVLPGKSVGSHLCGRKSSWLTALKPRDEQMKDGNGGKQGNSLRALAISYTVCCSYLYRNIFIGFIFFFKFQTCAALQRPLWTSKEKKRKAMF